MIRTIDPETCEVDWGYGQTLDPYGVFGVRPEEDCVGREYWARSPGCDVWINFVSLPKSVSDALMAKHRKEIMFPAGLFEVPATMAPFLTQTRASLGAKEAQ